MMSLISKVIGNILTSVTKPRNKSQEALISIKDLLSKYDDNLTMCSIKDKDHKKIMNKIKYSLGIRQTSSQYRNSSREEDRDSSLLELYEYYALYCKSNDIFIKDFLYQLNRTIKLMD